MSITAVNQLTAGGLYPHEDCGESCVASILIDAGQADTVSDIERYDLRGGSISGGTSGEVHVHRLQDAGIMAAIDTRETAALLADCRARGLTRVMLAVWSNHLGTPTPATGLGHWILWCGGADPSLYMQPVGGLLLRYGDAAIIAASQSYAVRVDAVIGAAEEEDTMTAQLAELLVFSWYKSIARRPGNPTQAEIDYWVGRLQSGENTEAIMTAFCATPEVQRALAFQPAAGA